MLSGRHIGGQHKASTSSPTDTTLMLDHVKDYYGKTLQSSADLQTDACCTLDAPPQHLQRVFAQLHEEVINRYYGCGLVAPDALEGMRILDLGSGSGRDVYALSALVGEHGSVVGVDMTDEQLAVAREYRDFHAKAFGYAASNVEFHKGYIEKLDELGFEDNSFDLIVSNCVINLSSDKDAVLEQTHRLLKPGGEMYFSDVYADRRVPKALVANELLYGECLSGALYWNDFINTAKRNGFADPRLVEDRPLGIDNEAIKKLVGPINFYSATYRLFKIDSLENSQENYAHTACYKGGIENNAERIIFDKQFAFEKDKPVPICSNTFKMLSESRFKDHFELHAGDGAHVGLFPTSSTATLPFDVQKKPTSGCC